MRAFLKTIIYSLFSATVMGGVAFGETVDEEFKPRISHANAATIFAKHSGLFDKYVKTDADTNECVSFLNKTGIYFGLLEVVSGTDFTSKDCARVMGQIELVLTGEAKYHSGKVGLPNGMNSWEEFCLLNDIKYMEMHETMLKWLKAAGQKSE